MGGGGGGGNGGSRRRAALLTSSQEECALSFRQGGNCSVQLAPQGGLGCLAPTQPARGMQKACKHASTAAASMQASKLSKRLPLVWCALALNYL